ncbi:aspartic peptidase domain-containing protein [Mycena filopes]|nr:aspartic peptidase domain-containing protein [Mycena filopes]
MLDHRTTSSMAAVNIRPQIGPFNDTGAKASIGYLDGTGENGTVGIAPFEIAGLKIPAQAFINATSGNVPFFSGLVGFAFDAPTDPIPQGLSAIGLNGSVVGKSVMSNIFEQYPDKPRFFAVSLSRPGDPNERDALLTIGEYDDGYSEVQYAPVLPQFPKGSGAWSFLMDGIFVNAEQVPWPVDPDGPVPDGQVQATLDTGTTHMGVPLDIRNFIYNSVPDALYTGNDSSFSQDAWIIPCNTAIDVHLVFGGQNFTVHPLDLTTLGYYIGPDGKNYTVCTGNIDNIGAASGRQALLGQVFLRNVYTVFGYGNDTVGPHAQLLSQTNRTEAGADFSAVRSHLLAGGPPELSPSDVVQLFDGPSTSSTVSSSSTSNASPSTSTAPPSTSPSPTTTSTTSSSSSSSTSTSLIQTTTSTTSSSSTATPGVSGGSSNLAELDAAAATNPDSSTDTSSLGKYGPVVIGLLGGNLALLLLLLGKKNDGGGRYTAVKLREDM